MKAYLDELRADLEALEHRYLRRRLESPSGVDFSSNDYLGIAASGNLTPSISDLRTPISAPASRLLRGNTEEHQELEARLAQFKGMEAALLFASGYQANVALLSTLLQPDDRVLSDELNHASLIDGIRLSKALVHIVPHRDVQFLERAMLQPVTTGRTFIVTESLFSMDGDIAPLDRYAKLAKRYGALLIVDDAHATGVFGDARGSGLIERFGIAESVVAVTSTFGKALGTFGACVTGPQVLIDYLINHARPFIFSTAPPQLLLRTVNRALDLVAAQPERRHRVLRLANRLRSRLRVSGLTDDAHESPIVPVRLGSSARALAVATEVRAEGFDVRAIRPPTVPPHTARLRLSIHASHSEAEIDAVADAILRACTAHEERQAVGVSG